MTKILDLLKISDSQRGQGFWLSGKLGQGEYKQWYSNNQLSTHCFYKNHRIEGEYKSWWYRGYKWEHCFYKDGMRHGEYKQWGSSGRLLFHSEFIQGKEIESYLI